jgi:uncharacterized protein (UPF0212 family)
LSFKNLKYLNPHNALRVSEMSEGKSMIDVYHLDTGSVKCNECGAIWRVYDKDLDSNQIQYGYPQYCMYCGKRMENF